MDDKRIEVEYNDGTKAYLPDPEEYARKMQAEWDWLQEQPMVKEMNKMLEDFDFTQP